MISLPPGNNQTMFPIALIIILLIYEKKSKLTKTRWRYSSPTNTNPRSSISALTSSALLKFAAIKSSIMPVLLNYSAKVQAESVKF